MTVKVGVTNKFNSRMKWEANQWKRDPADYEIVHKVHTLHAEQIEKECIKIIKQFNRYKVKDNTGSKVYAERFHYHRPIMRKIQNVLDSYKNKPEPKNKKSWRVVETWKWNHEKLWYFNSKGEPATDEVMEKIMGKSVDELIDNANYENFGD